MENSVVKNMGLLAQEAYKTLQPNTTFILNDISYKVLATSDMPSGFQGMLLEKLNVSGQGTGEYVFAFRGTETESGVLELWHDLAITDIRDMGSGTAPQQMKDAMSFVYEMMINPDYSINATNTTFTGHSLGGSLASMAS